MADKAKLAQSEGTAVICMSRTLGEPMLIRARQGEN